MSKKRKLPPSLDDLLSRPICYYCDKDFDDMLVLASHQKAKHFKCPRCPRRLTTAGGLKVHLNQVHKENLDKIENALPGREGIDIEIFGMEGFPPDLLEQKRAAITEAFYRNETEHRMRTGNPLHGPPGGVPKNPARTESKEDMKKRLAAFRAKKAAAKNGEKAADTSASNADSPAAEDAQNASDADGATVSSGEANANVPWSAPANPTLPTYGTAVPGQVQPVPNQAYPPFTQAYGAPAPGYSTTSQPFPMPGQGYPAPGYPIPAQPFTMFGQAYPPANQPSSVPGQGQGAPYRPVASGNNGHSLASMGATHTPLDENNLPKHNLPSVPGLPQRPSFSMNISKDDISRLHGHAGAAPPQFPPPPAIHVAMPNTSYTSQYPPYGAGPGFRTTTSMSPPGMQTGAWGPPNQSGTSMPPASSLTFPPPRQSSVADQVDDLIASITQGKSPLPDTTSSAAAAKKDEQAAVITSITQEKLPQAGTTLSPAAGNTNGTAPVATPSSNRSGRGKQTRFSSLFEKPEISPEEKLAQLYWRDQSAFKTRLAALE